MGRQYTGKIPTQRITPPEMFFNRRKFPIGVRHGYCRDTDRDVYIGWRGTTSPGFAHRRATAAT